MYLSIKQHDQFRTLLMGFEIPFRGYIADVLMTHYSSANDLETALLAKNASLTPADPFFLRDVLPNSVKHSKIEKMYNTFSTASLTTEIVAVDQDMPMVGALNIITFALTGNFNDLYSLFTDYSTFCDLAEKYRYARNKIDHPGCRTLEDNHWLYGQFLATVYKGNIIKNLIMDCQSYTKYRPNETTGGIFVSWRRKEELPTGA